MKYMNNHYGRGSIFGKARCKVPMNLQFFAEGGEGGAGGAGGSGEAGNAGAAGGEGEQGAAGSGEQGGAGASGAGSGTLSFDDILKDPAHQSEFDKRVAKALETQKSKMQAEIEKKIETAKTEAEKLARMNAEQKEQYAKEKRESELAEREKDITKRELSATAKETLADKGLPIKLADILDYTDAEKCNASIETVEKAFKEAVSKAVDDKLRGGNPPKKAPEGVKTFTKEQIAAMTSAEINQNWDAVQASMKTGL